VSIITIDNYYHEDSLDTYGNKSENLWLERLLQKQYDIENTGISRIHIANSMISFGFSFKRVNSFLDCYRKSVNKRCMSCGKQEVYPKACNDVLCNVCSFKREIRIRKRYQSQIYLMRSPKLMSFGIGSMKNIDKSMVALWHKRVYYMLRLLQNPSRKIRETPCINKFGKKVFFEGVKIDSAFCMFEVSPHLYLHYHLIVDMPPIEQKILSDIWYIASKKTLYVVDIRVCSKSRAMSYLLKYVTKVPEFESADCYVLFANFIKRKRRLSTYGSMYKKKRGRISQSTLSGESLLVDLPAKTASSSLICRFCLGEVVFQVGDDLPALVTDYFNGFEGVP
jgi:hypothetical protein